LTWKYRAKNFGFHYDVSKEDQDLINEATEHHIKNPLNSHHPDYHDKQHVSGFVNRCDRDKPSGIVIDATKMPLLDLAEMSADFLAMSEEMGNSPLDWARANINIRWKFTPKQEEDIYLYLYTGWGNHREEKVARVMRRLLGVL
jgi:hypothetical protein